MINKKDPSIEVHTLIFLDIDGTLLKPNYSTNSNNVTKIIKNMSKNGYFFCLNSNRSWHDLRPIVKKFKINGPVIGENGAFVILNGKLEMLKKLSDLRNYTTPYLMKLAKSMKANVNFVDTVKLSKESKKISANLNWSVNKFRRWTMSIHVKKNGKKDFRSAMELASNLKSFFGNSYNVNVSEIFTNVLVSPNNIDKGRAIAMVKRKYFPKAKIFMIGDDYADIPALNIVDKFYAVGNAEIQIKRKAYYVSKANYTKGVEEILNKIDDI